MVSTPSGSNPGFISRMRTKLLSRRPAPARRIKETAASPTTSALSTRCLPRPAPLVLPPSLSVS